MSVLYCIIMTQSHKIQLTNRQSVLTLVKDNNQLECLKPSVSLMLLAVADDNR